MDNIVLYIASFISTIPVESPVAFAWWFLTHGGFIFVLIPFFLFAKDLWITSRRHEYAHKLNYVLLAIDVPRETEQSPNAVEHIFATAAATYTSLALSEKWWNGAEQPILSFEIVSLGGYIQFLVRTETKFRDLIEASIYAQYPDAEITAVEDYVDRVPQEFDPDKYELWGTEFQMLKKDVYPIRTYVDFEHQLSGEFKDPMANLLEILGRIRPDEEVWIQLVAQRPEKPHVKHFEHRAQAEVQHIIAGDDHSGGGFFDYLFFKLPFDILHNIGEFIIPLWGDIKEEEHRVPERTMMTLTPGEKTAIEAIQRKLSKLPFYTKLRYIYWGPKATIQKGLGVNAVVGAIQQFTSATLNGFKPGEKVSTALPPLAFFRRQRMRILQQDILLSYKLRSMHRGLGHGFMLNTEELASIYHFPVVTVKAPLVKKADVKKAEPPFAVPVIMHRVAGTAQAQAEYSSAQPSSGRREVASSPEVPANLPFIE